MSHPPIILTRLINILAKPVTCQCTSDCPHIEIQNIAASLLTFLTSNLKEITVDTTCTCSVNPQTCAHAKLHQLHTQITSLVARLSTVPLNTKPNVPRVFEPVVPDLTQSPRESLEGYLEQRVSFLKIKRESPRTKPLGVTSPSVLVIDTPPQQPQTILDSPVSDTSTEAEDIRMAHPEPQAHSSRFDFTTMDTHHVVDEPANQKYVGWSYHSALAGVNEYVTLPTLLATFRQIRKLSFHVKAQRDEAVELLNGMNTVHPPAQDRRFPPNTILVNISDGVIAALIDKLRSSLDLGERYVQDTQHDTKKLGSIDDAKLTFHKIIQRINSIPRSAPPDQLAVYGIYTTVSFEAKYQLTWEQ